MNGVLVVEQGGRGGVADYTAELVTALAAEGVRTALATASDHRYDLGPEVEVYRPFYYLRGGTPIRDVLRRLHAQKVINALAFLVAVPRVVMKAREYDVVHLQGGQLPPLFLVLVLALRVTGATIVHTVHNTFDRGMSWRHARTLMARCSARVIVHAEADLGNLPPAARSSARVIPHGEYGGLARRGGGLIDRARAREELGLETEGLVALVFGQLRSDKGIADVLHAAYAVPLLHVLIAGEDRGALAQCLELVADLDLGERVHVFEGFHATERIPVFFSAADVVVIAYRTASQSGVLLLSYAFARPVVAYPVGGLTEVVEPGRTGWLTPRADADALSDTLAAVVAAGAEECRRRGEKAARLASARYGWSKIALMTMALYEDALPCRGS